MIVAIYPRVSTQEQAQSGYSIQEQIDRMTKYCDAMGWTICGTYTDAGFSGSNMERPGLQRLIKDVKSGKIDKVLVYKLDRLSRSQKDTLTLIEDVFLANGTDFVSMSENFDTSTPFGKAMIGILAVFAQLEREQIKERMKMGKDARGKLGLWHGSPNVPIGYRYINGKMVTDDFEKAQVIKAFELYAVGKSPYQIAKEFNQNGLVHHYGEWEEHSIRRVLQNRTYIGMMKHNGNWFTGEQERFVSDELFNSVQKRLAERSEEHERLHRRTGKANSYLGGLLFCAQCGSKYSRKTRSGKYRHSYYVCYSRTKTKASLVKDPNCKNKRWKMEELDEIIFNEIRKLAIDPEAFKSLTEPQQDAVSVDSFRAEISKLDDQISRLMDLYSVGGMPLDQLQKKIAEHDNRKRKLEQKIEELELEAQNSKNKEEAYQAIQSFGDVLDSGDYDEIRALLTALIERIELDGENITIHWNFT